MPKVTRLYKYFKPTNYALNLTPNAAELTFSGDITISGVNMPNSNMLRLHAKDLTIHAVISSGEALDYVLEPATDELQITLPKNFAETLTVKIEFSGAITKPMHGLYPCTAANGDIILATQFESHHAREVFPCVDEPEAKATFDLSITAPKKDTVLGNTPIIQSKNSGNFVTHTFDTTPIMSTYLLAFIVGKIHSLRSKTSNGTEVRVWASYDHAPETLEFALETSVRSIEFFNEYFQTPYPLAKCDSIALPDFSSGAMENWGLVTYREVCFLVDPTKTSASTKEYVATVIAHELSHQWFGNLVTMRWWDDLWLNESFATLMEYIAVDAMFPQWDIMLHFASQEALSALWRDGISGVQSVYSDVEHPDQISTLFDPSIVYAKGARLLLMARNFVGDAAFRKGLQQYFADYAYKNTSGDDLWNALSKASGKDVGEFMKSWLTKPGFPVLNVKQQGKRLQLSQKRFLLGKHVDNTSLWPIPLSAKPKISSQVLADKSAKIALYEQKFVRFNSSGSHYSVRYEQAWQRQELAKLIAAKNTPVKPAERLLVLNDSLMQAKNGISSITETVELLAAFANEHHEPVWNVISICVADARRLVEANDEAENHMRAFVYQLVQALYHELGWLKIEGEPLNTTKLRGTILSLATYSEDKAVVAEALEQYAKYESPQVMPADTRHMLLAAAVKHGEQIEFDTLFKAYSSETNSELQQDICGALVTTKKASNIAKILKNLTNQDFVRLQDVDRWIVYLLRNRWARQATWDWLVNNWTWIEDNFASDKSFDHYPRYAAGVFSTKEWLNAYEEFFSPKANEPALKRNIELGIEEISARVSWRERDETKLVKWLDTFSK